MTLYQELFPSIEREVKWVAFVGMLVDRVSILATSRILVLLSLASLVPTQPLVPSVPNNAINLSKPSSETVVNSLNASLSSSTVQIANSSSPGSGIRLPSAQADHNLNVSFADWDITATLYLKVHIGPWQLSEERIMRLLEMADTSAGKKPGPNILDKKFTVEEGSRINTMVFEIGPEYGTRERLTWADVAEVLGENGLPTFFRVYDVWTSTYFDVMDSKRGKLGIGAVRKWYQLEESSIGGINGSASGSIDSA